MSEPHEVNLQDIVQDEGAFKMFMVKGIMQLGNRVGDLEGKMNALEERSKHPSHVSPSSASASHDKNNNITVSSTKGSSSGAQVFSSSMAITPTAKKFSEIKKDLDEIVNPGTLLTLATSCKARSCPEAGLVEHCVR